MNICVLFSLLFLLAPGGCPIYSIDLSTLEVPNDFQNELTLQSMLSSELHQYRDKLNSDANIDVELSSPSLDGQEKVRRQDDPFDRNEMLRSIEDRIKATYYAAASPDELEPESDGEIEQPPALPPTADACCGEKKELFLGSNLFGCYPKHCFSTEEIALMSARQDFELLVPKSFPHSLLNDGVVYMLMKYFNSVNQVLKRMSDLETRRLLQRAFYDTLGGYLRYYLVPVAQVSYYAGRLKLCTVQRLVELYRQCHLVLNTNGNAWRAPEQDILSQLRIVRILPIQLNESQSSENDASNCALLDHGCGNADDKNEMMIVPLPHLEMEDSFGFLSNIFLPFKHRRIFNLRSPDAAFILVKFFKTVSNCYRFQGMSQRAYNEKLRIWIRENLQLHYRDEMFYPGLGGVLQIYETLTTLTNAWDARCPKQGGQNGEEPVLHEADGIDYDSERDEQPVNESEAINKKQKKKCKKAKNKESAAKRKSSRLTRQDQNQSDADSQTNGEPDQVQTEANEEECVECDDDNYLGYAAVILALLFFILLVAICCFLQKSGKKTAKNTKPKPPQQTDNKGTPSAPAPDPEKQSDKNDDQRSCWGSLFKSSKENKTVNFNNARKYAANMQNKMGYKLSPGMSMVGSHRDEFLSGYVDPNDLEKLVSRKKEGKLSYQSTSAKGNKIADDSFTSTSSLGYQFPRKFVPMKMVREKHDEYYVKAEKKRPKSDKKKTRQRDRDGDREREQKTSDPKEEQFRERQRQKEWEPNAKSVPTDKRKKNIFSKSKHRREEGGLAYSQEREKERREIEMRPSESDKNRNELLPEQELDCERKSSVIGHVNSFGMEETFPMDIKPETQPENSEVKSLPVSTPNQSGDGCAQSSKNTANWETTYDDDSN